MLSSLCPTFWLPWPCRIRLWFTVCCFAPPPRPSSRSRLIPNTWAPTSALWQFSTLGARLFALIPTCIVWSQEEDSHPIIAAGFPAEGSSFCPSKYSVWCSEESSWTVWSEPLSNTSLLWLVNSLLCNRPQLLPPYCALLPTVSGLSGCLRQTPVGWTRPSPHLSLSLYSSRRHRQLLPYGHDRWQDHLPLARLHPWQPDSNHDARGR